MRTDATAEEQYPGSTNTCWLEQDASHTEPLNNHTILFTDDNSELRELARILLQKNGYNVFTAASGAETLCLFRATCNVVDLIIIDIFLPDSNGHQIMEHVRKINNSVKILFTSGYSQEDLENKYSLKIPGPVLQKPFSLNQLLQEISSILGQPVMSG